MSAVVLLLLYKTTFCENTQLNPKNNGIKFFPSVLRMNECAQKYAIYVKMTLDQAKLGQNMKLFKNCCRDLDSYFGEYTFYEETKMSFLMAF